MHATTGSYDEIVTDTRTAVESLGCEQLTTPEAVDAWIDAHEGTGVVFYNSLCGCAGATARPALRLALESERPDSLVTLFAGVDREATARMRERFDAFEPSSPSFLLVKDGEAVELFERERIFGRRPEAVAEELIEAMRSLR